ncbi:hypothetical protein Dsin_016965 [Dipteronia sinensis]|uniref:HAT C-terminal dimerisation domain-containing protein n=1 Tax=Dipteronia sinensis TaxID=43782 RepID=A0AAE0AE75_9ROSI|nr:hypothetical protein Dsin_016965 [Dipteronia sinensis]
MTLPDDTTDPRAKCKFFPKDYATSRHGTGHLRRHMDKCMPAYGQVDTTTQTQLQRHPDRFGGVVMQPSAEPETQPMQTNWSILKRRKKSLSSSSTQRSAASSGAELNGYLVAQFDVCEDTAKFDLLLWWKTYSYRYPVMSHMARDILVIPVSTVSSKQAFSTSGRIIEPRRSCLTPEMVEVLTCVRDWEHSRKRLQNETVNEEFIQNFSNLFVDESSGSN